MCSTANGLCCDSISMAQDMAASTTKLYTVVINIQDSELQYAGRSISLAAKHLVPGTCYGRGVSFMLAFNEAKRLASGFKRAA
jgi:hypothetical protein